MFLLPKERIGPWSTHAPLCTFGWQAPDFSLTGIDGKIYTLQDIRGQKGTLLMVIWEHVCRVSRCCQYTGCLIPFSIVFFDHLWLARKWTRRN